MEHPYILFIAPCFLHGNAVIRVSVAGSSDCNNNPRQVQPIQINLKYFEILQHANSLNKAFKTYSHLKLIFL